MILAEFHELKKGDCLVKRGRVQQTGIVVELTDHWLIVAWEDEGPEAIRRKATVEVDFFCRNVDLLAPGEKEKECRKMESEPKGGKRRKTAR